MSSYRLCRSHGHLYRRLNLSVQNTSLELNKYHAIPPNLYTRRRYSLLLNLRLVLCLPLFAPSL